MPNAHERNADDLIAAIKAAMPKIAVAADDERNCMSLADDAWRILDAALTKAGAQE